MRPLLKLNRPLLTMWMGAMVLVPVLAPAQTPAPVPAPATVPAPAPTQAPTQSSLSPNNGSRPVYRCPGPPVLYTDALTPEEARERNCRGIDGAPLTVVQTPRRPVPPPASTAGAAAPTPPASPGAAAGAGPRPDTRVDPAVQRARDADARRILETELRREEERLEQLRREFNNGEPERRGDERNFALYQQRVAEMRAAIERKESDIAAIRRELGKFAP